MIVNGLYYTVHDNGFMLCNDAKTGEVLICCQRHFQHLSATDPTFRVHVVEGGQRRRVGDYLVVHEWP